MHGKREYYNTCSRACNDFNKEFKLYIQQCMDIERKLEVRLYSHKFDGNISARNIDTMVLSIEHLLPTISNQLLSSEFNILKERLMAAQKKKYVPYVLTHRKFIQTAQKTPKFILRLPPEEWQRSIIDGEELSKAKELLDNQLDKIVHDINANQPSSTPEETEN